MAANQIMFEVLAGRQYLAPFGATDITVTAGAGAWNPGAISANFLTTTTDIVIVGIEADPDNDMYDIEILKSDGSVVYVQDHCKGNAPNTPTISLCTRSAMIPSGTAIAARVQSLAGGGNVGLKIKYVEVG